jgi:hypothetical protein
MKCIQRFLAVCITQSKELSTPSIRIAGGVDAPPSSSPFVFFSQVCYLSRFRQWQEGLEKVNSGLVAKNVSKTPFLQ